MKCEELGEWPGVIDHALLHLIPKPEGGRRPIGLADGVCRVWEFARRPIMRERRASCRRDYDVGAKGRTSNDAVWRQALCDEAATASGTAAVTTLVDMCKDFEGVPLKHVWKRCLVMGTRSSCGSLCGGLAWRHGGWRAYAARHPRRHFLRH